MSATELTAIFLHEFGHNIDPALVDINYTTTNALSKYLTDRQDKLNDQEKKELNGTNKRGIFDLLVVIGAISIFFLINSIVQVFKSIFFNRKKALDKIRKKLKENKDKYDRFYNAEAFADNLPRMYGLGAAEASAFEKMSIHYSKMRESRFKREKRRQLAIADMVLSSIDDSHKTEIHRIRALIREYELDLKDPEIPDKVKDQIREDMEEVKLVLGKYLNSFSDFENSVNRVILEELDKVYDIEDKKASKMAPSDNTKDDKKS